MVDVGLSLQQIGGGRLVAAAHTYTSARSVGGGDGMGDGGVPHDGVVQRRFAIVVLNVDLHRLAHTSVSVNMSPRVISICYLPL